MWAIVTGGSAGLGLAISEQLSLRGYDIVIVSRNPRKLEQAAESIRTRGRRDAKVLCHALDLSLPDAPEKLHEWTIAEQIHPKVLVNNAGIYFYKNVTDVTKEQQESIIGLNISALASLCRLYGNEMEKGSHILNIASYSVYMPIAGFAYYAGSKAFIKTFSRCLGKELRPGGVYVTAVAPAGMDTDLMNLRPGIRRLARAMGMLVRPSRIAAKALHAMDLRCRYIIPGWYNALFIPFLWMFQPIFKRVLKP